MANPNSSYQSPLQGRYASPAMLKLFSNDTRYGTWRRLWVALAETEMELGLPITREQVEQLRAHVDDIDYDVVAAKEKEIRHDVMAHVYAYGVACPDAKGIIHLGATSCYVTDNADVLILKQGLEIIRKKMVKVLENLAAFAKKYRDLPTLGYTHLQPAQPVTVGKRATLWMQDLLMDYDDLCYFQSRLRMLGSRGTTGTQASFMELFDGDQEKVKALDERIARKMGIDGVFPVSGQTYPRKLDSRVLGVLGGIAQSAYRFGNDLRLLQHMREMEEPFEKNQVGSSAMAYKRNPMRSERICSLSRYITSLMDNTAMTASTQWFERTLDDSANRRISIPEAFLAVDGILTLYANIVGGLTVYPKVIEKHLNAELPFMATENILMYCVRKGGDRQELHEAIRKHSVAAGLAVKQEGADNDLLERIAADPVFKLTREEIQGIISEGHFTGMAEEQTEEYLKAVRAVLDANRDVIAAEPAAEINI